MKLLKEKIMSEGLVLNDAILKVDSFLNHQIDPELMMEIGKEFHRRFSGCGITKIFTIESSGIACALPAGLCMHVPVVFARKQKSALMSSEAYSTKVYSFTKKVTSDVTVLKKFLPAGEKILIIDDFLANGGDGFSQFLSGTERNDVNGYMMYNAIMDYLKYKKMVSPKLEGRVVAK